MENFMYNFKNGIGKIAALGLFPLVLSACGGEPAVSYSQDVKPIIDKNCIECHEAGGKGEQASGFNLSTYDLMMKGARFGPMVVPGDAEGSNIVVLMEGRADPSISMPHGQKETIPKEDIQTIRRWIKQGAKNN
jgi:hypothetical protein